MPQGDPQAYMKQGMSPQQAMAKAGMGNPGASGAVGGVNPPRAGGPPGAMPRPPQPPGQQGGAKGSAVQQVLSAADRVAKMAAQLGILDQVKQIFAKAGGSASPVGPRPMGGGPPGMGAGRPSMAAGPPKPPSGMGAGPGMV